MLCTSQVIAATNRVDTLDPALLRSGMQVPLHYRFHAPYTIYIPAGRLDRKIEFPLPTEEARAHIIRIHSRKMNVNSDTNYEELARCTDGFNGAQLKAVCVEAGMIALRRGASELIHEDYMEGEQVEEYPGKWFYVDCFPGILEVQAKKKTNLFYYA